MSTAVDEAVLKPRVKGLVKFAYFTDGSLWYETEDGWKFPIPVSDAGTGSFHAVMRGIFCMRWIRKYMEEQMSWGPDV